MDAVFQFEYRVLADDVYLSIEIGDRQLGTSVVKLDGKIIGKPGAITNLKLGKGTDLVGDALAIKTLVASVNDSTRWTSVTYVLWGGEQHSPIVAKVQVPNSGDCVVYRTTIKFLAQRRATASSRRKRARAKRR